LAVVVAVGPSTSRIETNLVAIRFYSETALRERGDRSAGAPALDPVVNCVHSSVAPSSEGSPRSRDRGGGVSGPDMLRAAAHAVGDRTDLAHAPALAGLLHNRADDMERNMAFWGCARQDVAALVDKYYGVYLSVARAVLVDPRYSYAAPRCL
jgi:hypothetical protein